MKIFYLLLFCLLSQLSYGQKLPDLQNTFIEVPSTVKVDGKDLEWKNYGAYNKKLELSYLITNDANNLFFVLKSKSDGGQLNKILAAGFKLTINTENKKSDVNAFAVTYPNLPLNNRSTNAQMRAARGGGNLSFIGRNSVQDSKVRDSILNVARRGQLAEAKEIKVSGFAVIPDSLISIYNEFSIKAVGNINTAGDYIYELSIPLKLLNLNAENAREISYQLKVNGINMRENIGRNAREGSSVTTPAVGGIGGGRARGGSDVSVGGLDTRTGGIGNFNDMLISTDVWAKYTISKK